MAKVFSAQATTQAHASRSIPQWDTDPGLIGIDDRCSASMSHDHETFMQRTINGFGDTTHYKVHMDTLKWHWEDDQG